MENEFNNLKVALAGYLVLHCPDYDLPFKLETDASGRGVGAVLSQHFGDGDHPNAYFSRKLNSARQKYTATEKEALAVVLAVEHFSIYLLARPFTIFTDHKALTKLWNMNNTNNRLVRWSLALQRYNFEAQYRTGKTHLNAGALSRQCYSLDEDADTTLTSNLKRKGGEVSRTTSLTTAHYSILHLELSNSIQCQEQITLFVSTFLSSHEVGKDTKQLDLDPLKPKI